MFVCLDCGFVFEEPQKYVETHGFDHGPFEVFYACPNCAGAYAQAYECDACGNFITSDTYIKTDDNKRYCDNCYVTVDLGDE